MNQTEQIYNPFAQNIAIVKSYFKKPTVLAQGILYILSAIASVVTAVMMSDVFNTMFDTMLGIPEVTAEMSLGEYESFKTFADIYTSILPIASVIPAVIIAGLFATGFMLLYFKSKNDNSDPKSGATILFVLSILQLIPVTFMCLIFLLVIVILAVVLIVSSSENYMNSADQTGVTVVLVIYLVLFVIVGGIALTYSISRLKYYSSVRKSLTTVNLTHKGAGLYGVFTIIYGVYTAINSLSSLVFMPFSRAMLTSLESEFSTSTPEYVITLFEKIFDSLSPFIAVSVVVSLISATTLIIEAVIALGYKKHIGAYTEGYTNANYEESTPSPQYSAPQVQQSSVPFIDTTLESAKMPSPSVDTDALYNTCPNCNCQINENSLFCSSCGQKLK